MKFDTRMEHVTCSQSTVFTGLVVITTLCKEIEEFLFYHIIAIVMQS